MGERRRRAHAPAPAGAPDLRGLLVQAVASHQAGRLAEAERLYAQVLAAQPHQFDALHLLGLVHYQRGDGAEAVRLIDRAIAAKPDVSAAHNSRAAALNGLKRFTEAVASCDRAIALDPTNAEALSNRGLALVELERFDDALASCERAVALRPDLPEAFNNRGNALKELERFEEALASYSQAIALRPDYADGFNNCANALIGLKRFAEALDCCQRAIALRQDLAEAYYNRGIALHELKRHEEALASYDQALALRPDYPEALVNRGTALTDLKRCEAARDSYARALGLAPEHEYLAGMHLFAKMRICDWTDFDRDCAHLARAVAGGTATALPFHLLPWSADPAVQLACAGRFVASRHPPAPAPLWRGERYAHERIRVAYLSADLRDHPVSLLAAGLFEQHDRSRFEVTAISHGPDAPSPMRARLTAAFDRFIDAEALSDADVAQRLRELEIDIAVDLNGFTEGLRPDVLARRPVPVQVNYLGYAGTMGGRYWDYILADRFVVPDDCRRFYAEQVVALPHAFMVTDAGRKISDPAPTRAQAGLPESGFVFCCFNNSYKITPDVFDVWMRLLGKIEGSVLWLAAADASATDNLRREAQARGIAPDRLIFAPKVPLNEDHLARLGLADLFLDTRCYNAHATAADALWVGLPVLACAGASFASRVAGSLLAAVGLPELITYSLADYEALALRLAGDRMRLAALRQALARNRLTHPLFDTGRFVRDLEAAYTVMWERTQRGEPPAAFAVASC
ncbi:MAG TPA: tetratricopeptide repeat protein [Xanthobacteraceae bacterium]|nr:tetratricopeptide repeat protein [Xanthobacteraceae bacterium]